MLSLQTIVAKQIIAGEYRIDSLPEILVKKLLYMRQPFYVDTVRSGILGPCISMLVHICGKCEVGSGVYFSEDFCLRNKNYCRSTACANLKICNMDKCCNKYDSEYDVCPQHIFEYIDTYTKSKHMFS